jgi:hypothetical protein
MRKYVLTLAVLAVAPLLLAMPGNAQQANSVVAAGAVPLSDEEMDNVSAAGLALGKNGLAPGQLMKTLQLQLQVETVCQHGRSCYAPGQIKGASTLAAGVNHGNSGSAPGRNK